MSKILLALCVVLSCAACAGPGASAGSGGGSITMYGTIDEGISVRK